MKLSIPSAIVGLTFIIPTLHAETELVKDCDKILSIAQNIYSQLFPGNPATQTLGPWCFRFYDSIDGDTYAGIYGSNDGEYIENGVYTLGGVFGGTPYYVGQTDSVLAFLESQTNGGNSNNLDEICDTTGLSSAISYRTEGDTTYVTTNGQCIELPDNRGICDTPAEKDENQQPVATNVHLLTTTTISNLEITGIDTPGFDLGPLLQQASNTCVIHAPSEVRNHTIHSDICIDVTRQITSQLGGFNLPGINPPITTRYEGTSILTRVDNCNNTDAEFIVNLVTGETTQN